MFKKKYESLVANNVIENPNDDVKKAKTVGKYKVSSNAIYRPDNKYVPVSAITSVVQDKGSVHVTGCCIGCVPTDRLVVMVGESPFMFDFDSEKQVMKARDILGI